jgi:predicted ATPase with chaperone activity
MADAASVHETIVKRFRMNTVVASSPEVIEPAGAPAFPPAPESLGDTGLTPGFVGDLLMKTLYVHGARTGQQLAETICLPFALLDELLHDLQQRRFVEVRGTAGHGRSGYLFDLVTAGRERAQEALAASQYVGPAPVPLAQYSRWLLAHSIQGVHVTRASIADGFREMVLDRHLLEQLGPAVNSAKSLFIYGDSGNGKTLIADTIAGLLGGTMYVPYAVKVDGQIMLVYDPVYHRPPTDTVRTEAGEISIWRDSNSEHDRRFARVRRPVVVTGGELTLEELDLQYDRHTKLYQAPFQVKANGGVLIIDDFGRQRVPPRDLLNRWIVPLEKRIDYLTLHTGGKFPVPFDSLLIFATNLDPKSLVEEAFLRRIHYKIHVVDPTPEQYAEIFRRCCVARGITFVQAGVEHVYREYYGKRGIPPRSCHPRDILDHLCDVARFLEVEPHVNRELLDRACESYFLDVATLGEARVEA